ncbi:AzlC family ABC transporter permease [Thermoflavimicrobium dichotomicum]|uniref:4-azaleucine resistance probable transporter AzlC n=1 Tax=Thermoflavimicrobium dichotomicum TaxID=46223 RepID=A0A1I3P136_9BACL|nr:AzlC family ABC transporter permease [Thermoflavimicrobium dichotomicum]SFJ15264.1 4-azaleucine resistance probable transporter AzlC [Thermoflavimicrobium dichotomicum]
MSSHAQEAIQSKKHEFSKGMMAAMPLVIGYLPIAVAFGVMAQQMGLSVWQAVCMSALVYAGASQFMAIGMIAAGTGMIEIVFATFVLNFRHFVMGLSLMNRLKDFSTKWKIVISSGITDETFAVASLTKGQMHPFYIAGLVSTAYFTWVLGTLCGGLLANMIPPSISTSMSIALYAMFIGLLVPAIRGKWKLGMIAVISMGLNSLFSLFLSSGWSIILATIIGSSIGIFFGQEEEK